MKVAIYGQFYHENSEKYIALLLDVLQANGIEVIIEKNFFNLISKNNKTGASYTQCPVFETLDKSYDFFFSIGGDGTILRSITFVKNLGIPIVGINTGRLGFLATIQKEEIKDSVAKILNKEYSISQRGLITISTVPKNNDIADCNFALNEIAISRRNTSAMIKIEAHLNEEHLTSYWSDGLIIATPTGSTGYSLSCGGPVIDPENNNFILTPIAPHNLNVRPLVVSDDTTISLKVSGREDSFFVSLDSRITTITNDTVITLRKADFKINIIQLKNNSFLKTLRKKLLWGEDKRN